MAFTPLNHYLDYEGVRYAYELTRKDGAVGVDGQTAEEYATDLDLLNLIDRLKLGQYRAPPVRRQVYIPKADGGGQRGLGFPCFEDKVAQGAIVMLLEPIYEQDSCGVCVIWLSVVMISHVCSESWGNGWSALACSCIPISHGW